MPEPPPVALSDLAWLVHNGEKAGSLLFEEIVKQNTEILMLLHELQACRETSRHQASPVQPNAA